MTAALLDEALKLSDQDQHELVLSLVDGMSVLNLSALVKRVESRFGVTAAPAQTGFIQPPQTEQQAEEVKTDFAIVVTLFDASRKIQLIKEIRTLTGLGLKEAKELIEKSLPVTLKDKVPKADAEAAKKLLEASGATVALK